MLVFEKEDVEYNLGFPKRCFFCLVDVSSNLKGDTWEISHQLQFPVKEFQQVFNHLHSKDDSDSVVFVKTPPICDICGPMVNLLQAALEQLTFTTNAVTSRIKNVGNDEFNREERLNNFLINLLSVVPELDHTKEALSLLKKIGHGPFPEISLVSPPSTLAEVRIQSKASNNSKRHELNNDPLEEDTGGNREEGNLTNVRQDERVLEWKQNDFNSEQKSGDFQRNVEIEKMDEEEPEFVADLKKQEVGFENEMEFDLAAVDEELFDEDEDVNMDEEPIFAFTQESREQDPLTEACLEQKPYLPEDKQVGTVKSHLLQGISKPEEILEITPRRLCDFCRKPIIVRQLLDHIRGHVGDYAKRCPNPTCNHVYALFTSMKSHVASSSSCRGLFEEDVSVCEVCGHRGRTVGNLLSHLKSKHETGEKSYPCPVSGCSETFTLRQTVNCHLVSHVVKKEKQIIPPAVAAVQPCPDCGMEFPPRFIQNHLINHHGTCPESVITCKYCPFTFPSRDKLVPHYEIHFQQGQKLSCDLCHNETLFDSLIRLRKHYFLVHKVGTIEFLCEHCNKGFFLHRSYRKHVASKHPGEVAGVSSTPKPQGEKELDQEVILGRSDQSCDFCGQSVNLDDIMEHVRGHVGDFALPCPNPMCRYVFSNICILKKHTRKVQRCRPFLKTDMSTCEVCGHKATNVQSLRGHLKVVHEIAEKPYPCPVSGCLHRFSHRQTVQSHIVLHTSSAKGKPASFKQAPPSLQACPTCQVHLPQDEIRGHLEKVHGALPDSIVACNYCPYLFPSRDKMVDHWNLHITSGIPVSCDLCSHEEKFLSSRVLRDHYWTKHQVGSPRVVCEQCNKSFAGIENLRRHIQLFHSGSEKIRNKVMVKCGECPDQEFRTEQNLMSHKIKFHGADPFKCQFCGKEFQMWNHLSRHENEHRGVKRKVVTCDFAGCGKSFFSLSSLKEHQKSKEHAGITNAFICGQCGKGFNYETCLKTHEQCVHGTERAFVCDECGKSFKRPSVLKEHKMIHTGEKPFQCDICPQRFRYKKCLNRHLQGHEKKGAAL